MLKCLQSLSTIEGGMIVLPHSTKSESFHGKIFVLK